MSRGKGLTLEQHRVGGAELEHIRDRLHGLAEVLEYAYGFGIGRLLMEAAQRIDEARGELNAKLWAEPPELRFAEGATAYYAKNWRGRRDPRTGELVT